MSRPALADYPVASHRFLADPAAMVHDGRVYVYCSNDDDNVKENPDEEREYLMASLVAVSSSDMKNWTDHGEVIRVPRDASWARLTWAPATIERNGTFYLYFPNGAANIGVATSSSPAGPFKDARGTPLVTGGTPGASGPNQWIFDPGVFLDDDGQAYLYFGGNGESNGRVIRLNEDMISVSGSATSITLPGFFEALWMHKYNGVYYLSYSTNPANGLRIDYATSDNPMTDFRYRGIQGGQPPSNSNNNHASTVELDGDWYHVYHNRVVAFEAGGPTVFRRNIAVEKLEYASNGDIIPVTYTRDGVEQRHNLDPFVRVEAETFNAQRGIETEPCEEGGMNVSFINAGDWVRVRGVDFKDGAESFLARVASAGEGGAIELRLDALDGPVVGTCAVTPTGGWQEWADVECDVEGASGVHDLYLAFTGGSSFLFNFDYWRFTPVGGFPGGDDGGVDAGTGGLSGGGAPSTGSGGAATTPPPSGAGGSAGSQSGDDGAAAEGCGCRSASSGPSANGFALSALVAAAWGLRRRRARERASARA